MVTDGNSTCGKHFMMYITVESLCCAPDYKYIWNKMKDMIL